MRRLTTSRSMLAAGLFCAIVSAASPGGARQPAAEPEALPAAVCPDPGAFCKAAHPGSTVTQACAFGDCFQMNYGAEMRIVAADERGDFPMQWFIWQEGGDLVPAGTHPCILTPQGKKKTRVEIDSSSIKCRVDLVTDAYVYHEHIVSNPAKCLGWVECRGAR